MSKKISSVITCYSQTLTTELCSSRACWEIQFIFFINNFIALSNCIIERFLTTWMKLLHQKCNADNLRWFRDFLEFPVQCKKITVEDSREKKKGQKKDERFNYNLNKINCTSLSLLRKRNDLAAKSSSRCCLKYF